MRTTPWWALALLWTALVAVSPPAGAYVPEESPAGGGPSIPVGPGERVSPLDPAEETEDGWGEEGIGEEGESFGHRVLPEATSVPPARAGLGDIERGASGLPEAAARTRADLLDAARSGDIERLRPIFARQRAAPIVSDFATGDDPVDSLRIQSGDPEGREILAILSEILESGYVAIGEGAAKTFVWPYFAEVPLSELTPPHYVEVYRVLTAVDVEEMVRMGRYTFFRVGIAPDGRVRYFSAGDFE